MRSYKETAKSILLAVMVATSLALTVALWVQTPPISSLPPELAGELAHQPAEGRETFDVFAPVAVVLHDGAGNHEAIGLGGRLDRVNAALVDLLRFMRPGDVGPAGAEEVLGQSLLRDSGRHPGATFFLAGEIPLELLLADVGGPTGIRGTDVDRLLVMVHEDAATLRIYFGGRDEWLVVDWDLIPGLEDGSSDDGFPVPGAGTLGGEAAAAWSLFDALVEEPVPGGESMVLLPAWRDITIRPLLVIPEMDLHVETSTARSMAFAPGGFFPEFDRARSYVDSDGARTYTDGFRTLRIDGEGRVRYVLATIPGDDAELSEAPAVPAALARVREFLAGVMPPSAERLILCSVEPVPARDTLDLGEGSMETAGYRFEFAQRYGGTLLRDPGYRLQVTVDGWGVREARLAAWVAGRSIRTTRGITPLSALENLLERGEIADPVVDRIDLVRYPAESVGTERVIRPAWSLQLDGRRPVLVDATTGEIVGAFE